MATALLKDLNIIILRVPDLDVARTFYGETLGMTIVEEEGDAFLLVNPVDGQGATLGIGAGEASAQGPEIWWRTADADALHKTLIAKGVKILQEPTNRPFGRFISFSDPAGTTLYAYSEPR